jgi:hypothetical protein
MARARRDPNRVPTLIGVSVSDGETPATVEVFSNIGALVTAIVDASGNQITSFGVDDQFPAGTGDEENKTLTNASTAYAVPTSAPTEKYVLVMYNISDTDVYWSYKNSASGGIILETGEKVAISLGANQQVYLWCGSAGKIVNLSWKEIA